MQTSGGSLPDEIRAAYEAPFPDQSYMAGARVFPSLVPIFPDDPEIPANKKAWEVLAALDKPFLTAFSDSDPVTAGMEKVLQERVAGAKAVEHVTIRGAGHFLQEDKGPEVAQAVIDFVRST
jgi:haloalkane dehalogenase